MKEMKRQNDSENERNRKACGKVTTVIRVKITSAGVVNQGAEAPNTSEQSRGALM